MSRVLVAVGWFGFVAASLAAQAPVNDLCANAIQVYDGVNPNPPAGLSGSFYTNVGAGTDGISSCNSGAGTAGDVWFKYVATATGTAVVKVCRPFGFALPTIGFNCVAVFLGCNGPEISCMGGDACQQGSPGTPMIAGTTYWIRVASNTLGSTVFGNFYLTIVPPAGPPANDLCSNATPVFDGVNPAPPNGMSGFRFTNVAAANEGAASCDAAPSTSDVWFSYTATASGIVLVRTCTPAGLAPGSGQVSVSVFGSCGGPELACASLSAYNCPPATAIPQQTAFVATAGATYIIRAATFGALLASFHLTIVPPGPPPPNDACANAIPLSIGVHGIFTNAGATQDGTSSCVTQPAIIRDVWYQHTATGNGVARFTTVNPPGYGGTSSLQPAQVTVFAGCGGPEIACSVANQDVNVLVTAGTTYWLRVATFPNLIGLHSTYYLTIYPPVPPPANDECAGAIGLAPGLNGSFSNSNATASPGGAPGFVDTWFSLTTGACAGAYTVEGCPIPGFGLSVHGACGGSAIVTDPLGAVAGCTLGSSVTFFGAAFTTYFIRTSSFSLQTVPFNLTVKTPTTGAQPVLALGSPLGPTSIQADLGGLPISGLYFFPVTTNLWTPGSANNFFGLDMTVAELLALYYAGPPFFGTADACGSVQAGPYVGVPSGVTFQAVALGFATGLALPPTTYTATQTYTVP